MDAYKKALRNVCMSTIALSPDLESADEGDNYMQYSSVQLYSPSISAVAKNCP